MGYETNKNHIYSMSYGGNDSHDNITPLDIEIKQTLAISAKKGRGGLGAIYVKAAGNGRKKGDNCAFEEDCNSI